MALITINFNSCLFSLNDLGSALYIEPISCRSDKNWIWHTLFNFLQPQILHVLYEHASGYALFRVKEFEEVGMLQPEVEESVKDLSRFNAIVKLVAFSPFRSGTNALDNMNSISEGRPVTSGAGTEIDSWPVSHGESRTIRVSKLLWRPVAFWSY